MQEQISTDRLSDLIGLIYDAAIDPIRWPTAMEAIRIELDFRISTLNLQLMPSGDVLLNITENLAPEYAALIPDSGADVIEQWGGAEVVQNLALHEPHVLTRTNPSFDLATSTNGYYLAFAKPQGLVDVLAVGLARDGGSIGTLAFGRHVTAGPIGDRELDIMRMLVPHLQRAVTINRMMDQVVLAHSTLAALNLPVMLVDDARMLVYASPAAAERLKIGDPLRSVDGRLEASTPALEATLAAALDRATADPAGIGSRGLGLAAPSRDGAPGAVHVIPIRGRPAAAHAAAVCAIFLTEAGAPFVPPTDIVAALFGLTPSEARAFEAAARGETMAKMARSLGIAPSTAKTHLLRVYEKVGVSRQVELTRLAESLALPTGF